MNEWTSVSHEGCEWKFSAESCRKYKTALAAAEAEVTERFGQRPHFRSPDAVAAWEHEVVAAAHTRLFGGGRPVYNGAVLPVDTSESWATVEAFRRGQHSPTGSTRPLCSLCAREIEYGSCRWTDCPGNAGVEDTNYL